MGRPVSARLYVPDDLAAGQTLGLAAAQAHYLRHVLRLDSGARVALFNGRDGEWHAEIDGFGRGWCSLTVDRQTRPQTAGPDVWLAFAPLKRARLDFLVQKAVELGASALQPVITQHTDVSRVNTGRLRSNVVEAAEQCERLTLPEVREPCSLSELAAQWPASRRLLVCAEQGPAEPIWRVLERGQAAAAVTAEWGVLTGPEGGFAASELDAIGKLPFVTLVSLGPRILRAETAALAALACWQAVLGDWHSDRI